MLSRSSHRKETANLHISQHRKVDLYLLFVLLVLVSFGLMMVYDVSVVQALKDYGNKYYYLRQQSIWVVLGLMSLPIFTFFDYHRYKKLSTPFLLISSLLLLAVFIPGLGVSAGGAHRWLSIGGFTIQPVEIIKLATIIYLSAKFEKSSNLTTFLLLSLPITFIIGFLQKDLGSSIVFFLITTLMYIYSGAPLKLMILAPPFFLTAFFAFILKSSYRKQRILAFLDPFSDPQGYSYHISQVLIALGTGGLFGLGLGQSRQKYEYIPEVTTDSIFAVVGEEFGFLGSLILIALFAFLIYRAFLISQNSQDRFGSLLSFGLTIWLGTQIALNLASMVSLVPLTGVPLPLISYGGSALIVNLVSLGILLNISRS